MSTNASYYYVAAYTRRARLKTLQAAWKHSRVVQLITWQRDGAPLIKMIR